MNDLEPWKIWAVTGALVCLILGSTAARLRPPAVNKGLAQAATLTPNQVATNGSSPVLDSATDQNDSYVSYSSYPPFNPHPPYSSAGFAGVQLSTIMPVLSLPYGSQNSTYQGDLGAALDVTHQLYDDANTQFDQSDANSAQSNYSFDVADVRSDIYASGEELQFLGSSEIQDEMSNELTINSMDGPQIVLLDQSGAAVSGRINLELGNVVLSSVSGNTILVQGSVNGAITNFSVNLTQGTTESAGIPLDGPISIDQPVSADSLDEAEDLYEVQSQAAVMAAGEEAIAQDQAALQRAELDLTGEVQPQKSAIIRSKTAGLMYFAMNDDQD